MINKNVYICENMLQMENINTLLRKMSVIQMKYDILAEADEQFNIFSILHKEHDERRLHSRFISALLSPNGSHKMGTCFLDEFLQMLNIETCFFNNAIVYPSESDKSENCHLDILIIDRNSKSAIIIENKINAGDCNNESGGQLERYYEHVIVNEKIPEKNIYVFYLTLDGHDPSDTSLGTKYPMLEKKYVCLSYRIHIQDWMRNCFSRTASFPFIRESISQYIILIRKMTNDISVEERLEIKRLIGKSSDNMKSTKLLVENFKHVKWHTVRSFWDELAQELQLQGYEVTLQPTDNDITNTTHFESYKKGYRKNDDYGIYFIPFDGLQLYIWNDFDYYLYYGIEKEDKKVSSKYKNSIMNFLEKYTEYESTKGGSSLIWKEFDFHESEKIYFADFSYEGTFNLINDDYRKKMIHKIITELNKFINRIKRFNL